MYEHVVLEKYRVDSAGTHLQVVIPDKDVSYYITEKKSRCGELRIDDGRYISAEQRKKTAPYIIPDIFGECLVMSSNRDRMSRNFFMNKRWP